MRMSHTQFMRLPVVTVSGAKLGTVRRIILDIDTFSISQCEVKSALHPRRSHLISHDAIVAVSEKQITVSDSVVKGGVEESVLPVRGTSPISASSV